MLKFCDANTNPNDRDYGFYHNGTARQASFFCLCKATSFQRVKHSGGSRGRGELARFKDFNLCAVIRFGLEGYSSVEYSSRGCSRGDEVTFDLLKFKRFILESE